MDTEKMNYQLMARLAENYADYSAALLTKDRQTLINDAENIAHVQNAYEDVTGEKNGVVRGNLFERDRHQFAEIADRGASPHTDETLTFISGEELRIPREEFKYSSQADLEYDHGKIMEVRHEAEDESVVQGVAAGTRTQGKAAERNNQHPRSKTGRPKGSGRS